MLLLLPLRPPLEPRGSCSRSEDPSLLWDLGWFCLLRAGFDCACIWLHRHFQIGSMRACVEGYAKETMLDSERIERTDSASRREKD